MYNFNYIYICKYSKCIFLRIYMYHFIHSVSHVAGTSDLIFPRFEFHNLRKVCFVWTAAVTSEKQLAENRYEILLKTIADVYQEFKS